MPAVTKHPAHAAWSHDRPDAARPPLPETPFFNSKLNAWILTCFEDVAEALRNPTLVPASLTSDTPQCPSSDEHHRMRSEAREELTPAALSSWKEQLLLQAEARIAGFLPNSAVDLLVDYAHPLCLSLAAAVTGIDDSIASELYEKTAIISAAAADPYNTHLKTSAESASEDLKPFFRPGPKSLREAGFVALSRTLPALLGNIWFTLIRHPREWQRLHQNPDLIPQAIEEAIRYTGFTRVLVRFATAEVTIGEAVISKGQRVILRLQPAHHDPQWFERPNRLDIMRRSATHLAFGSGPHACVGAGLLRMACSAITHPLISSFSSVSLIAPVQWRGGATFIAPQALVVDLDR